MSNVLDVLLKTVKEVQRANRKDKNVPTADPSIFDLLKGQILKMDKKVQGNRAQGNNKKAKSILEMLQNGIEGVRKDNRRDPKMETADKSIFQQILKQVQKPQQKQASSGLRKIVQDYNLDIRVLPKSTLKQIQESYQNDLQKFNKQYANAIYQEIRKRN